MWSLLKATFAAGSVVVIVVWVYYSAQILLFGAEFTKVWTRRRGSGIRARGDGDAGDPGGPCRTGHEPSDSVVSMMQSPPGRHCQQLVRALVLQAIGE